MLLDAAGGVLDAGDFCVPFVALACTITTAAATYVVVQRLRSFALAN